MCMFSSLNAERGKVTAVHLGDETALVLWFINTFGGQIYFQRLPFAPQSQRKGFTVSAFNRRFQLIVINDRRLLASWRV